MIVITKHPHPLERLVSRKMLFQGQALRCLLWLTGGSIMLCLMLMFGWLMASVLVDHGRLELTAAEFKQLQSTASPYEIPVGDEVIDNVELADRGILPAVWQARTCVCGKVLAAAHGRIQALQRNSSAVTFLAVMIGLTGALCAMMYSRGRTCAMREAVGITTAQRRAVHRQTLRLAPSALPDHRNGELRTLFSSDMDQLQEGLYYWTLRWAREPVKLILLAVLAIATGPIVAGSVMLLLLGSWLLIAWQKQQGRALRALGKSRAEEKLRLLAESLNTTRLVRGYGKEMEAFEDEQFQQHLAQLSQETTQWMRQDWVQRWGLTMLAAFVGGVVLMFVGNQILNPTRAFSLPSAILLILSIGCMHGPLRNLWNLPRDVADGARVSTRIENYLGRTPHVGQAVGAKFLQPMAKSLIFDNVVFEGSDHESLLNGCSFQVKAGTQVAVVSMDPWEARTVAHLLPRFIEPKSGQILIDGEDVAWVTLDSLRAEAIMVSARDPFFTGTVLENIRCGDTHYSLQDVTDAAKLTHAHNFILKLPLGYETVIGEHGEQLDPGQVFRLGLARAVLRDPALLIIEEPEEPMDEGAKSLLDDAYNRIRSGRTIIYLPHRMATLRRADEIIVLHKGQVAAMGNHAALVKSSSIYAHWEYSNFNTFRHKVEAKT
ncbi:putative multidrug export ATP-binding/permease protein [Symmachiella macrocystis]|uniref:Putative multidrug export ATP-binding/permease protein n=1 Tax=Symmachiella macrocystis TaxID=2527985 RepID=A0A5C6BJ24_9PLAN|nr:putative multidrug export ATP-binding/permease protein [Symmachiella macrocystis]